jgi:hypothetical protein
MAHYITVPINANGVIDPDEQIEDIITKTMSIPFGTTDVFVYSHGWWTTADAALKQYNVATTDFIEILRTRTNVHQGANPFVPFLIGIHWPSMLDDDPVNPLNHIQLLTYYTMEKRADDVGDEGLYAILQLILKARPSQTSLRLNLFGHSFGCKVICSALQRLAGDQPTITDVSFSVVLLQAAFRTEALDDPKLYGTVIPYFKPALLISKSAEDYALTRAFPAAAFNLVSPGARTALGATGPSPNTASQYTSAPNISVDFGSSFYGRFPSQSGPRLVVADLTPLHSNPNNKFDGGWGGHHNDVYRSEIYDLMAWFLF